jgi:ABC-type branched-subunit amino acid transport system substrate-binding protein
MHLSTRRSVRTVATVVAAALATAGLLALGAAGSGAALAVRGFDGTTIKVAGLGIAAQFPGVPVGSKARIKRFNDTNEIKGIKIDYVEYADDKQDPATALSEARRLVTQDQVFAIVGDTTPFNPAEYFAQQQVPYFGWAFDSTYCSPKVTTSLWGFGYAGCIVADNPPWVGDLSRVPYEYVSKQTGKAHPTMTIVGNDSASGKNAIKFDSAASKGAGFDVVSTQNSMPQPPVPDYTPYVQAALTADNGKAPDVINCALATDCIPMYAMIKASGYKGLFLSGLYSNLLVGPMQGSGVTATFVNPQDTTPGMTQLKKDVDALEPGQSAKVDSGMIAAYASTDMFIQALKTVAKKGKSAITPANVQKAASVQKWRINGLAGPTNYPQSTGFDYPLCMTLMISDGTTWNTVVPFGCSTKKFTQAGKPA